MAPTLIFSCSPAVSMGGLIPTFKFPNSARMRSVSVLRIPSPSLILPPPFEGGCDMVNKMYNLAPKNKATLKTPSPCLMLPPTFDDGSDDMVYNMYNLVQNKVIKFNNNKKLMPEEDTRIVGSSHGWLSLFNERNYDLILTNPVTGRHVKLPPSNSNIYKVILSCDAEQEECQAMMIDRDCRLAFCCPGRSPTEWTPLGVHFRPPPRSTSSIKRCYEDFVYSRRHNLFFCATQPTYGDDFEAWDVASDPPRLRWENRADLMFQYDDWLSQTEEFFMLEMGDLFCNHYTYLVFAEKTDQLYFVTRHMVVQMARDGSALEDVYNDIYPYKTVLFDVHKLEWEFGGDGGRLTHLDGGGSLDGLAMFVGLTHSFAVSATDANGLKPNSIYFTDDKASTPSYKWEWDVPYGGHDIGIFDYENKTISSCYYPCDIQNFKRIMPPPIWFTPTFN